MHETPTDTAGADGATELPPGALPQSGGSYTRAPAQALPAPEPIAEPAPEPAPERTARPQAKQPKE